MKFAAFPESAAWRHVHARDGFEVSYFQARDDGYLIEGCTTAVEDGRSWIVRYALEIDAGWATRRARITGRSGGGSRSVLLEADGAGEWRVDGVPADQLRGCLDVDLEASAMTNTLPVHRAAFAPGVRTAAPAAYVRALDLGVERLDQDYLYVADDRGLRSFDYAAPVFDTECRLVFDESGLVLNYPGLAVRAA